MGFGAGSAAARSHARSSPALAYPDWLLSRVHRFQYARGASTAVRPGDRSLRGTAHFVNVLHFWWSELKRGSEGKATGPRLLGSCRRVSRPPAVGLQGCLRGPGVPPPPAEPPPLSRQPQPLPAQGVGATATAAGGAGGGEPALTAPALASAHRLPTGLSAGPSCRISPLGHPHSPRLAPLSAPPSCPSLGPQAPPSAPGAHSLPAAKPSGRFQQRRSGTPELRYLTLTPGAGLGGLSSQRPAGRRRRLGSQAGCLACASDRVPQPRSC